MTTSPQRFSVAMCTYNGARFLPEQLKSIDAQSLLPAELVITDDGSSDRTADIVAEFAARVPFPVRFSRNASNLGSTRNFERAIGLCTGEWIALCDQDDIWHVDRLAKLAAVLDQDRTVGAVFSDGRLIDDDSRSTGKTLWQVFGFTPALRRAWKAGGGAPILFRQEVVTGATLAFRADLRDRLLPMSTRWVHDAWMAWILVLTSRVAFIAEPLIDYRVHTSQQEGVPGQTLAAKVGRARRRHAAEQRRRVEAFTDLRGHLQQIAPGCPPLQDGSFDRKIALTARRAGLPNGRLRRFGAVLSILPEYQRFTRGLREAAKDILFR